jgi:NAD(P)-dependent dehydrogenase (short-subunit alcohol dehydrogenase family)
MKERVFVNREWELQQLDGSLHKVLAGQAPVCFVTGQAGSGNQHVDLLLADLSSQAEVRRLAQEFRSRYSHLYVLINNAGVAPSKR